MRRLFIGFVAVSGLANAAVDETDITHAWHAGDIERLNTIQHELANDGATDLLLQAYLNWRLGNLLLAAGDKDGADAVLERSQAELEGLTTENPGAAQPFALLAGIIGSRIGVKPVFRGMKMGSSVDRAIESALTLAPNDPRVLLIAGIGAFNTPRMFGGGRKKALAYFDQALQLPAEQRTAAASWAFPDLHVWRAMVYQKGKMADEARRELERALQLAPDYRLAGTMLDELAE